MRIGFCTLGCKLNQYETEALASSFRGQGHVVVSADDDAEAYVVNTCTVTGRADHKSRAAVRSLSRRHPQSLLIVTGCSAQLEAEVLSSLAGNILVVPQSAKGELLSLAERVGRAEDIQAGLSRLREGSSPAPQDPFAFRVEPAQLPYPGLPQGAGRLRLLVCVLPRAAGAGAFTEPGRRRGDAPRCRA